MSLDILAGENDTVTIGFVRSVNSLIKRSNCIEEIANADLSI